MKKVLLTGASGFIGGHLVKHLQQLGYETIAVSHRKVEVENTPVFVGSFLDQDFLNQVFAETTPDFVVHLACKTQPGRDLADLDPQLINTIRPALNVANALTDSVKLAIFFGSCEEYGNAAPPFEESMCSIAFSPYGWGKISAQHGVSLISKLKRRPVCWVRPFLTFGQNQKKELLVPALIRGCLQDERIPLTLGEQSRDFVYVKDLCRMVGTILSSPEKAAGETINLCSGQPLTVRFVAQAIQKVIGKGVLDFGSLPYRACEAMQFYGSPRKYNQLFGTPELTTFEQAIQETVESYRLGWTE